MNHFGSPPRRQFGLGFILFILLLVLMGSRAVARFVIEYEWWREMGQVDTWLRMLNYAYLPVLLSGLLLFVVLWVAHARGMKAAGTGLSAHPNYARISTLALLALSVLLAAIVVDGWAVVRFAGGLGISADGQWRDPVFNLPLKFYFFHVPFYATLLRLLLVVSLATAAVYWLTTRAWTIRDTVGNWRAEGAYQVDLQDLNLGGLLETKVVRAALSIFLLALAGRMFLKRYELLFEDHSSLVGVDWVASSVTLPLLWLTIVAAVLAAVSVIAGKWKPAAVLPLALVVYAVLPGIVTSVYVKPSEISIQRPYIERHIKATRAAFGLTHRAKEVEFDAKIEAPIDMTKHKVLFDNVRLWDWRAFHDTVTQIQALRPYYVFNDSDVDRYIIDGQLRQTILTPRELDVNQLPGDARQRWINPHFIYTHGYGMVMAEAARITPDGLPNLMIQDAPPVIKTNDLKLTRPEIYYGEVTHDPVFVRTGQPEFNYPSGAGNVETRYEGKGGFPISSPLLRFAATLATGDWNIVLTSYLKPESRMMVRRKVRDRLGALASFLEWDADPYLVVTDAGRLVWMVDGYTTSESHPYSRTLRLSGLGEVNYIRNSVKATIDAYDGTVHLYVFDETDPVLQAYRNLFPALFSPKSEMPPDLRSHARYPEFLFRVQAEMYRTYHMTDPEAFFNKEDVWDLARNMNGPSGRAEPVNPTYLVATLPAEDKAEFLLMTTFTPRNKDNMIGLMVARCDGDTLGELIFLQLSKQELVFGPMQVEARITQDQYIAKDLSLWNQQGSQVLRGQMLVLPVDNTFVYIEPIYLQASEARMPQLKKVVMAMGNRLIYTDTYDQALAEFSRQTGEAPSRLPSSATSSTSPAAAPAPPSGTTAPDAATLNRIREHLRRHRELLGQGKYGEAGKEMEAIEKIIGQK